jgi:hypothetical protein
MAQAQGESDGGAPAVNHQVRSSDVRSFIKALADADLELDTANPDPVLGGLLAVNH